MAPIAAAAYVQIAATLVLAVLLGASGGAMAAACSLRIIWGGLLAAGIYFAQTVLLDSIAFVPAAAIGLPPLIMTLLVSWLAGRALVERLKWRRLAAAPAAFGGSVILGFLCLLPARISLWAPTCVTLAADLCLLALLFRTRKAAGQPRMEESREA